MEIILTKTALQIKKWCCFLVELSITGTIIDVQGIEKGALKDGGNLVDFL